jgi:hypothetical protein
MHDHDRFAFEALGLVGGTDEHAVMIGRAGGDGWPAPLDGELLPVR